MGQRLVDEELGAAAGHEDTRLDGDTQTVEPGPAENVFEGQSRDAPVHHGGDLVRGAGGGEDELRLVLGEDTACGTERGDNEIGNRGHREHGSREPFGEPKGALAVTYRRRSA